MDRGRIDVVVFDFRFCKSRFFDGAPHDRAQTAVEATVQQELADFIDDLGFRREIHGDVAVRPLGLNAEPAEISRLLLNPLAGILAALGPELQQGHGILVLASLAILFLDPPFDGQSVAIPTRQIADLETGHAVCAVDDVLHYLVKGMACVDVAIGVWRAIVEREDRASFARFTDLAVQVHSCPAGERIGLTLRQTTAHRETGAREEYRVAVAVLLLFEGGIRHDWTARLLLWSFAKWRPYGERDPLRSSLEQFRLPEQPAPEPHPEQSGP